MGPILAAVDFSDATRGVVNTAMDLARALQVKLYLLHVAGARPTPTPNPELVDYGVNPQLDRQLMAKEFRQEHRELQKLAGESKAASLDVTSLLIQGSSGEKILQEARRLDAGMIVMGTHGHSRLYDLLMGSVSREVLQNAPCPVVMVPYQVKTLG